MGAARSAKNRSALTAALVLDMVMFRRIDRYGNNSAVLCNLLIFDTRTIMSLPERTTVLIIGAGPSGLSTALSLVHQGFRDLVIVEARSSRRELASRAMTIHASTLEVLMLLHCVHP